MSVPRMRTLPEAFEELKRADPSTAYTLRALRAAVKNGEIPVIKVGSKRLINLDCFFDMLNMPSEIRKETCEGIRKVI